MTNEHCPICGQGNNCCYGREKSLGECWCTEVTFPHAIFEAIEEEDLYKKCICKGCLDQFKEKL